MNTLTYTLSSDTLAAGTAGIDIFEVGRTNLVLTLSGIEQSSYHYTKFVFNFGDGTDPVVLQDPTNTKSLSSKSVSHVFTPSTSVTRSYKISATGYTTKGTVDNYCINLGIAQSHINNYRDVKIISSHLYTSKDGKNNLLLTIEAQNPRFLANMIIPYDIHGYAAGIVDEVDVGSAIDLQSIYLRTEIYTAVGGEIAIVGEHTGAYFIREHDLIVFVIGSEDHSTWSGQQDNLSDSIAIVLDNNVTITDINGNDISPELLLVPEVSFDETEDIDDRKWTATPSDVNLPYRYK